MGGKKGSAVGAASGNSSTVAASGVSVAGSILLPRIAEGVPVTGMLSSGSYDPAGEGQLATARALAGSAPNLASSLRRRHHTTTTTATSPSSTSTLPPPSPAPTGGLSWDLSGLITATSGSSIINQTVGGDGTKSGWKSTHGRSQYDSCSLELAAPVKKKKKKKSNTTDQLLASKKHGGGGSHIGGLASSKTGTGGRTLTGEQQELTDTRLGRPGIMKQPSGASYLGPGNPTATGSASRAVALGLYHAGISGGAPKSLSRSHVSFFEADNVSFVNDDNEMVSGAVGPTSNDVTIDDKSIYRDRLSLEEDIRSEARQRRHLRRHHMRTMRQYRSLTSPTLEEDDRKLMTTTTSLGGLTGSSLLNKRLKNLRSNSEDTALYYSFRDKDYIY